jgi:hypothetical protein
VTRLLPAFRLAVAIVAGAALGGCHSSKPAAAPAPELGHAVGDSATFGALILRFELDRHRAVYRLTAPAYVVLLVVTPSRSIEIAVGSTMAPAIVSAGTHMADVRLPTEGGPQAAVAGVLGENASINDRIEFDRCVANAIRVATPRPTPPPKVVRTDSLGRPIDPPPTTRETPPEPDAGVTQRAEAMCQQLVRGRSSSQSGAALSGGDRERYLLLLASDAPVGIKQLTELEVAEGDIQSIVAAIARKLYAERQAAWSGYYYRW